MTLDGIRLRRVKEAIRDVAVVLQRQHAEGRRCSDETISTLESAISHAEQGRADEALMELSALPR